MVSIKSFATPRQSYSPFDDPFFEFFFGPGSGQQRKQQESKPQQLGLGSGVIISEDGYIVTNNHVIQGAEKLEITLNEQLALAAGLPEEQMGLGHAFEMDPKLENGFLMELAQAQMLREIFPKAPLKFMPPTKFMTGCSKTGGIK